MKIIRNIGRLLVLSAVLTFASSCEKWLTIEPLDKIPEDKLFSTVEGFNTAINGLYLQLADNSLYGASLSCGFLDILGQLHAVNYNSTATHPYRLHAGYQYTEPVVKGTLGAIWAKAYFVIANCNNVLEQAEKKREMLGEENYQMICGQMYAVRALLHFDVFRLWGPMYDASTKDVKCIPYYDRRATQALPLLPAGEVLDKVMADLVKAEEGCTISNVGFTSVGYERIQMNYFAVKALQAKVWLYAGDKVRAAAEAKNLIQSSEPNRLYDFVAKDLATAATNPDRVYFSEQLFCIQNSQRGELMNTFFSYELQSDIYTAPLETNLKALFPDTRDFRFSQWKQDPGNGKSVSFVKFQNVTDSESPLRVNIQSIVRMSELWLIMAECSTTNEDKASYLSELRQNRGFQAGSVLPGDDLEKMLNEEYKREFYGEGQYFFYMKRNKMPSVKMGFDNSEFQMGEAQYVAPLPDNEIQYR